MATLAEALADAGYTVTQPAELDSATLPVPEFRCPSCGAVTRALMADDADQVAGVHDFQPDPEGVFCRRVPLAPAPVPPAAGDVDTARRRRAEPVKPLDATCRGCRAKLTWATVQPSGKPIPLEAYPDPDGNVYVVQTRPLVVRVMRHKDAVPSGATRYRAHFADTSCPLAAAGRRRKPKQPPQDALFDIAKGA